MWYEEKTVSMNAKLLYESAHLPHKRMAKPIGRQTLRLMGSGAEAYDPVSYQIQILQPTGTKHNRRQVKKKQYQKSILQKTREPAAKRQAIKRKRACRKARLERDCLRQIGFPPQQMVDDEIGTEVKNKKGPPEQDDDENTQTGKDSK